MFAGFAVMSISLQRAISERFVRRISPHACHRKLRRRSFSIACWTNSYPTRPLLAHAARWCRVSCTCTLRVLKAEELRPLLLSPYHRWLTLPAPKTLALRAWAELPAIQAFIAGHAWNEDDFTRIVQCNPVGMTFQRRCACANTLPVSEPVFLRSAISMPVFPRRCRE